MRVLTILLVVIPIAVMIAMAPLSERDKVAAAESAKATTAKESQDLPTKCYAVIFDTGPLYDEDAERPQDQPGIAAHVKYITGLFADGVVPLAGPLFEDEEMTRVSGVLYFVFAGSFEEARDIVMQEPLVKEKVVEISSISVFIAGVGSLQPEKKTTEKN